ncbi:hypothetical protein B0H14DRAFT_2586400 [Mycena olivaceomarginata]|nr:hypothetical protein B0H14DRAFT_2586400 [Mycena olivaceomarginata]
MCPLQRRVRDDEVNSRPDPTRVPTPSLTPQAQFPAPANKPIPNDTRLRTERGVSGKRNERGSREEKQFVSVRRDGSACMAASREANWAEQPVRGYKWWGRAASAQCIASRAVDKGGGSRHDGAAARRTSEGTEERHMTRRGPQEDGWSAFRPEKTKVQQATRRHALLRPALDADTTRGDAEHRTRGRRTCSDALMWRGDYVNRRYGCVAGGGR